MNTKVGIKPESIISITSGVESFFSTGYAAEEEKRLSVRKNSPCRGNSFLYNLLVMVRFVLSYKSYVSFTVENFEQFRAFKNFYFSERGGYISSSLPA